MGRLCFFCRACAVQVAVQTERCLGMVRMDRICSPSRSIVFSESLLCDHHAYPPPPRKLSISCYLLRLHVLQQDIRQPLLLLR